MVPFQADVIHPAPGSLDRPSFTSLVANVDSDTAKYIADCRVQTSRQEMIDDLEPMAQVCSCFPALYQYQFQLFCAEHARDVYQVSTERREEGQPQSQ